jgi:hypothetical protein
MEAIEKEVYFNQYCPKCKHKDVPETEDPCNECLTEPTNEYSHKPVRFEDGEK